MGLYQEILFLKHYFKGGWVVENVIGYYKPLIIPQPELGYHILNCAYPNSQKPLKDYYKQETLI